MGLAQLNTDESVLTDNYFGDSRYAWSQTLKIKGCGLSAIVSESEVRQSFSNFVQHTKFHVGLFSIGEMGSTI
jgi:hypothetical protein